MTATQVQEHKQRAHEYGSRAQAIREKATGELTAEQAKEIDDLLDKREAALKDAKRDQRLLDAERAAAENAAPKAEDKPKGEERSRDDLLRDGFVGYLRGTVDVESRDALRSYSRDAARILRPEDFRAQSGSIDTEGGYVMMPPVMLGEVLKEVDDMVFMRQLSRVLPRTPPNGTLGFPYSDNSQVNIEWSSELTTATPTDIDFQGREFKPQWVTSEFRLSRPLLQGASINVEAYVRGEVAIITGEFLEQAYMTGTGGNRPLGVFTAHDNGIPASRDVTSDTTNVIGFDDVIDTFFELKVQYQRNASWLLSREALKRVVKIKGTDGHPIWREGLSGGDPSTLLARPVYMSEFAPAGTSGAFARNDYMLAVGDFNRGYWICDSDFMEVQRLTELYARQNRIGVINRMQTDGAPVLAEAFARLKSA